MINSLKAIREALILCNSYERFPTFYTMYKGGYIPDEYYWEILREAYEGADNLFNFRHEIKECFSQKIPDRNKLMEKEELEYLSMLPDNITLYRGMTTLESKLGDFGISWTLDKKVADFFANKYGRNFDTHHFKKYIKTLSV